MKMIIELGNFKAGFSIV